MYSTYLASEHWKKVGDLMYRKYKYKCFFCAINRNLEKHHITYANKGNEQNHLEDLVYLCGWHHELVERKFFGFIHRYVLKIRRILLLLSKWFRIILLITITILFYYLVIKMGL
jgi:hypothetical protein